MPATHNWGSSPNMSIWAYRLSARYPILLKLFPFEARLLHSRRKQPQKILYHRKHFLWRQFMSLTPKPNDNQRFSPAAGHGRGWAVSQSCPRQSTPCHPDPCCHPSCAAASQNCSLTSLHGPSTSHWPSAHWLMLFFSIPEAQLSCNPHTHPEIKPRIKSCGSQPY